MTDGFYWWSGIMVAGLAAVLYLTVWLLATRKKKEKEQRDMREHLRKKQGG